jgi:predicted amidophosphoribosyltransferase
VEPNFNQRPLSLRRCPQCRAEVASGLTHCPRCAAKLDAPPAHTPANWWLRAKESEALKVALAVILIILWQIFKNWG